MAERGRAFGGGRTSVAGGDRRRSVSRAGRSSVATASQSEKLARGMFVKRVIRNTGHSFHLCN